MATEEQHKVPLDELLLEEVDIRQSETIEKALLQVGEILADTLLKTDRYDEAMTLCELITAFNYAASCYGEKTGRIREDLGVSLSESVLMKAEAFRKNNLVTPIDDEWWYFAKDAQETIQIEKDRLRE